MKSILFHFVLCTYLELGIDSSMLFTFQMGQGQFLLFHSSQSALHCQLTAANSLHPGTPLVVRVGLLFGLGQFGAGWSRFWSQSCPPRRDVPGICRSRYAQRRAGSGQARCQASAGPSRGGGCYLLQVTVAQVSPSPGVRVQAQLCQVPEPLPPNQNRQILAVSQQQPS